MQRRRYTYRVAGQSGDRLSEATDAVLQYLHRFVCHLQSSQEWYSSHRMVPSILFSSESLRVRSLEPETQRITSGTSRPTSYPNSLEGVIFHTSGLIRFTFKGEGSYYLIYQA